MRLGRLVGATREARRCDSGGSSVRLGRLVGATREACRCDSGGLSVRLGEACRCDSGGLSVRLGRLVGATREACRCDSGGLSVRLGRLVGATREACRCDPGGLSVRPGRLVGATREACRCDPGGLSVRPGRLVGATREACRCDSGGLSVRLGRLVGATREACRCDPGGLSVRTRSGLCLWGVTEACLCDSGNRNRPRLRRRWRRFLQQFSILDRADRRREVLDESLHGPEDAGVPRHLNRGDRWVEGHQRGARCGVSRHDASDVRGASTAAPPRVCELETAQTDGRSRAPDLRPRRALTLLTALDTFERGPWGLQFPTVVASWRRAWTHVIPFFAFPPEVRRVIYTTNALESVQCARAEDHQDARPLPD